MQLAGVRREVGIDERDHLARDGVGFEARAWWDIARTGSAERLAVVGVEVPLAADGFVAVHQHAMALALLAVEILHAQGLAALGMGCEFADGAEEVAVFANLQWQTAGLGHGLHRLKNAPVARCGHHQSGRSQARDVSLQLGLQAPCVVSCIQLRVVQRAASGLQGDRKVPHRRQEQSRARLARPHVSRFVGHLRHPHGVGARVEAVEGGRGEVELIAQHDDEVTQFSHVGPCRDDRLRSSASPRPSSSPNSGANSWADRRPHKACSAVRPCCRETWRCAASSRSLVGGRRFHACLAHALHQPSPATRLAANSGHAPALSAALAW